MNTPEYISPYTNTNPYGNNPNPYDNNRNSNRYSPIRNSNRYSLIRTQPRPVSYRFGQSTYTISMSSLSPHN